MAPSRAMNSNRLRNRKPYDMSAQLSANYHDNHKQNIFFLFFPHKDMTQKYFSATQLVISLPAAPDYSGIPKQSSSRYAEFQIYEKWNVLLKDLGLDSLGLKYPQRKKIKRESEYALWKLLKITPQGYN